MGQSRMISLVFICVELAQQWQWSHSKQYGQDNKKRLDNATEEITISFQLC